eukprot:CAMPEP_0194071212 /NCGR_PEP_ID=MMETSP0009_2-20130614/88588_1 /TAXON_ID=210454 /ORGANISM="Grammatophora oceanica, Strain CCMP 410" /LENGTH=360 /DNA_ID=CAMNT_0038724523 /DNA_START=573 /DNA_END=1655 /DNA_ORIENTATION=+
MAPSDIPSTSPTTTQLPTNVPSQRPSFRPSQLPSDMPSFRPTNGPTTTDEATLTQFCVIADVPYKQFEVAELKKQIATMPSECEFLVHLGDIKTSGSDCTEDKYQLLDGILNKSLVPTFMVAGDNEWNDCPAAQRDQGWSLWTQYYMHYHNVHWKARRMFDFEYDTKRKENFAFVHKRTLFVGLNLVGGTVVDLDGAWHDRLIDNYRFLRDQMRRHVVPRERLEFGSYGRKVNATSADGVVLMGHTQVTDSQSAFFNPLRVLLRDEITDVPFLYLHGDGHLWFYRLNQWNLPHVMKVQTTGGTVDPMLVMKVNPHLYPNTLALAFDLDRRLHLQTPSSSNQTSSATKTTSMLSAPKEGVV